MNHYTAQNTKLNYQIRARLRFRNVAKSDICLDLTHMICRASVLVLKYSVQIICIITKPLALLVNVAYIFESSIEMKSPTKNLIGGDGLVQ